MTQITQHRAQKILVKLKDTLPMPTWADSRSNSFETLIGTIISQNTTSKTAHKAFERLSNRYNITAETLAKADKRDIENALKIAGLYRSKAEVIVNVSKIVMRELDGSLDFVSSMPLKEARERLMSLPGVGPKTADVVMLFSANRHVLPVDTHVNRVSKRLGLTPENGGYEEVRTALESLYTPEDYLAVHLLLIALGRKFCRALNPRCGECPVNELCPSRRMED